MAQWLGSIVLVLPLVASGCAGFAGSVVQDTLAQRGQVLRQWQVGDVRYSVIREGNRVVEYRVVALQIGLNAVGTAEPLYAVDTVTQLCFAGPKQDLAPCDHVALDPVMCPYVTWLPR